MGFISWLASKFNSIPIQASGAGWADDVALSELYAEACYRDMALWTGVDIIAKAISKCEFKTFENGAEKKGAEWYLWNIEPNRNQSSSAFLRQHMSRLYFYGESLIVEHNKQLLVADNFVRKPYALYDDVFTGVTVGDFTFSRSFNGSEVMYWNLNSLGDNKSVKAVIEAVCASYAKVLAYGMKSYQTSRGNKALFKYEALPTHVKDDNANEWLKGQLDKYGKFLASDGGVATVGKGISLEAFDRKSTYSNETTRDIRAMVDDISDFTSKSLGIPPPLLRGDVQGLGDALEQFLTFCIDPLADFLREEIVRKRIRADGLARGYDLVVDTKQIKHVDLLSVSTAIDKLIASGAFCINDIHKLTGDTIIDEPYAWQHWMTNNYSPIEEVMRPLGGGEKK